MMHAYHTEPCHPLNPDQRHRMREAISEVETVAFKLGNPAGYRVFHAYISTNQPRLHPAGNGYLNNQPTHQQTRTKWWKRRDRRA